MRVLELIHHNSTLDNFLNTLPEYFSTPEIRINCPDKEKFFVVKELGKVLEEKNYIINKVDGLRVTFKSGWWLLRASNTQEALIVRIEAKNKNDLYIMKKEIEDLIKIYDLSLN